MNTITSLFVLAGIAVSALTLTAAEPLVSPHCKEATPAIASAQALDFAQAETSLGHAARAKSAGPAFIAASPRLEPSLVACAEKGKASCKLSGTGAPCCTTGLATCK